MNFQPGELHLYGDINWGTEPWIISLGKNVHITEGVNFITHDGGTLLYRHLVPDLEITKPIIVGDDVYIGNNVIILPGVKIGNNVVIGAGAIVSKDIPDNSVAVGVPARVIKTADEYFEKIQKESISKDMELNLTNYKVTSISYPYGEYSLGNPAEIIDEGAFYRIDGTHIFDKFKIISTELVGDKLTIRLKDKDDYTLTPSEKASTVFRRSIYCSSDIRSGEAFSTENTRVIRPGYGLKPKYYDQLIGTVSKRDIKFGERITEEDL